MTKTYTSNEYEGCMCLIRFLERLDRKYFAGLSAQIKQYQKFLMLFRCPEQLDFNCSNRILEPYGGIPIDSRIILYGAGGMGRALYSYLVSSEKTEVILWADRSFELYQSEGLPVDAPARIKELPGVYDFVIIAVTSEKQAQSIHRDILSLGVPDEKIKWLTSDFIQN